MRNTAAESGTIQYTCSVTFGGSSKIVPSVRWTSGGSSIADVTVTSPSDNRKDSVYIVTAETSDIPSLDCEAFFPTTTVSGSHPRLTISQDTPTYTDSRSFPEITVTCKLLLQAVGSVFSNLYSVLYGNKKVPLCTYFTKDAVCFVYTVSCRIRY